MVIDKIGNIKNIVETKKTQKVSTTKKSEKNDSIQISSEGKKAAENSKISQVVHETPDIRADRVNDIKERIANGTYDFNDEKMLERVADKIAGYLLRQ
ncbi:MAG: flagellar biosynthesis anti-sigma factor FlgM [bacterium]|nr:flagellar biosynthesis anti-sigma factor FlgM [bacterium]